MQNQDDLVYSYLVTTKFYDTLRSRLNGYLSTAEVKQLVRDIYRIVRYKSQKIICQFDQPTIFVIIYGELRYNDQIYKKGQYFTIQNTYQNIEICYLKPSTLVLLNREVLDFRIAQIVSVRDKIKILQRCMPVRRFKWTYNQIRKIAKLIQGQAIQQKYTKLDCQPGIYLFYEGIFQLCDQDIPVLEMENNFIQITDKKEFIIRLKDNQGKYGFIERQSIYQLLETDAIIELQRIWRLKQNIKNQNNAKKAYIQAAKVLRQKINKKFKLTKKYTEEAKSKTIKMHSESLDTSRNTMLQKCSTVTMFTTPKKSRHSSPQKTCRSLNITKSAISLNYTSKLGQKYNQSLTLTEERLQKMRSFSKRKRKTQLQKQWYHLDPQKSSQYLNETYWKIKRVENPRQAKALCNYKRVHRIYSDPCFRKTLNFRNF